MMGKVSLKTYLSYINFLHGYYFTDFGLFCKLQAAQNNKTSHPQNLMCTKYQKKYLRNEDKC